MNAIRFSVLAFIVAFYTSACGRHTSSSSSVRDEVDPNGQHEYHFFGNVHFRMLDKRKFPDAMKLNFLIRSQTVEGPTSVSFDTATVPSLGSKDVATKVLKGKDLSVFHDVVSPAVIYNSVLNTQNFSVGIDLKRIDVNDMLITRQDGSTYYKSAEYSILRTGPRAADYGWVAYGGLKTKTGVDVPTGYIYSVRVTTYSEEGVMQDQSFELDFTR